MNESTTTQSSEFFQENSPDVLTENKEKARSLLLNTQKLYSQLGLNDIDEYDYNTLTKNTRTLGPNRETFETELNTVIKEVKNSQKTVNGELVGFYVKLQDKLDVLKIALLNLDISEPYRQEVEDAKTTRFKKYGTRQLDSINSGELSFTALKIYRQAIVFLDKAESSFKIEEELKNSQSLITDLRSLLTEINLASRESQNNDSDRALYYILTKELNHLSELVRILNDRIKKNKKT